MIGIGQDYFRPYLPQVFRGQGLYRPLGAHRHKDRGGDLTVGGPYPTPARPACAVRMFQRERKHFAEGCPLGDQHGIAIAVKTVILVNGLPIGPEDILAPGKGRHQ